MERPGRVGHARAKRWRTADAQRFLSGWRASGEGLAAYCRSQRVGYERVRRWRRKLETREGTPTGVKLRELKLQHTVLEQAAHRGSDEIAIELASGLRIRLSSDASIEAVIRLIRALQGPAC